MKIVEIGYYGRGYGKALQLLRSRHGKNAIYIGPNFPVYLFQQTRTDIRQSIKSLRCLRSGFVGLEARANNGWEEANPDWNEAWFVCASFQNNRHIPLPIVLGDSGSWLQKLAVRVGVRIFKQQTVLEACSLFLEKQDSDYTWRY